MAKKIIIAVLSILFLVGIYGCKKGQVDLKFSHKLHVVENEIECSECHKMDDNGKMQNPDMDKCGDCHDIGDVDNPTKHCLMCHTLKSAKNDYSVENTVNPKPKSYADLIFTHEPHEDYKCSVCHKGLDKTKSLRKISWPKMDTCKKCHNGDTAPIDCDTCHKKIRKNIPPENHKKDWEKRHGFVSKFDDSCRFCHDPEFKRNGRFCQDCHQTKKPKDHIFNWKTSQHGIEAIHDRKKCAVCHTASFCSDCHYSEKPLSHKRADWVSFKPEPGHAEAARRNIRSCAVCHTTSECSKCHSNIILNK